jgi:hypothetical protein
VGGKLMRLVRDLLDAQLVDRNDRMIGRVDGIVLDVAGGAPPRVVAMEVGLVTFARRIHPRLGRWLRAFAVRRLPVSLRPVRLPLTLFRDIGVDVELDVDAASDRRLLRVERWLQRRIVERLPAGRKR